MTTLLLTLGACLLLLAIIFFFVWQSTDWRRIDEANNDLLDSDGDHVYYDRELIKMKKDATSQKYKKRKNQNR